MIADQVPNSVSRFFPRVSAGRAHMSVRKVEVEDVGPKKTRIVWPPDHHLFVGSLNFRDGPNPNRRTVPKASNANGSSSFLPFHPEYPPCQFDRPPFLQCRRTSIGSRHPDPPARITIGPGSYTPDPTSRPRTKIFRKTSPPREIWTHLKRTAPLPDPGQYYTDKPMWTRSVSAKTTWPPRTTIVF
jgi:hypothetical protein